MNVHRAGGRLLETKRKRGRVLRPPPLRPQPVPEPKMNVAIGNGGSVSNVGGWDLIIGGGVSDYASGNRADVWGYSKDVDRWCGV